MDGGKHPRIAYIVTSRARTIGIFYIGQSGTTRFTRVTYKKDRETCVMKLQRATLCKCLQDQSEQTLDRLDTITLKNMKARVIQDLRNPIADNNNHVCKRIVNILIMPNDEWKKMRENCLIV